MASAKGSDEVADDAADGHEDDVAQRDEAEPAKKPAASKRARAKSKKALNVPRTDATLQGDRDAVPRPQFARGFPDDETLDALVTAFQLGDYERIRREAPRLADRTTDPEVKRAALELGRRIKPDPVSLVLVLVAMLLLSVLSYHYLAHPHAAAVPR